MRSIIELLPYLHNRHKKIEFKRCTQLQHICSNILVLFYVIGYISCDNVSFFQLSDWALEIPCSIERVPCKLKIVYSTLPHSRSLHWRYTVTSVLR